jgi:hypothetical protein
MSSPTDPDLPDFLPGRLTLRAGTHKDYLALCKYHYAAGAPATWAGTWTIDYADPRRAARPVAVGVLSYPVPSSRPRERHLRLSPDRRANVAFANRHVRTISRVIVHPQFRALGLSSVLVRWICSHCPVRYVEAMARMGDVCPLFERGGMTRVPAVDPDEPAYFVFDRETVLASHFKGAVD